MRLLLFGGTGQVGTELRGLASAQAVEVVAPVRSMLDLNDGDAIGRIIAAEPWSAVVNAAGYTNVDGAESEEAAAFALNATAAGCLAAETARYRIPLVHISTDYVFDGRKGAPYVEADRSGATQCLWPQQARRRAGRAGRQSAACHPAHRLGL